MTTQPALRIKSYFAVSVDAAITQARAELGDDALLLNTRKLASDAGQPAGYEVVFGLPGTPEPAPPARDIRALFAESRTQFAPTSTAAGTWAAQPTESAPARTPPPSVSTPSASIPPSNTARKGGGSSTNERAVRAAAATAARFEPRPKPAPASDDIADELSKLQSQMDEIRSLLVKSTTPQVSIGRTVPELADVYSRLMAAGVDSTISKDIVDRLEASMSTDAFFQRGGDGTRTTANRWKAMRFDAARLEAFVRSELETRVAIEPMLGGDGEQSAVVVMVGPTGAGKTTSIMKLAASDRVAGRRVRILSLDTSRPGQNHLNAFASNLGIQFSPVASIHALPAMIAQTGDNELVFIDTPGYANTGDRSADLAALVLEKITPADEQGLPVDVHLVAPAYMKGADLRRQIHKYSVFRPSRILATKLDETDGFGSVFSEAARAQLALSFFASGIAIPEDIRPAATEDLLSLALERKLARAQCA